MDDDQHERLSGDRIRMTLKHVPSILDDFELTAHIYDCCGTMSIED